MSKINDDNLYNIQRIFESKTQVRFRKKHTAYFRTRRAAVVLAAVLSICLMTAFTYPLFSPLAGDALDLSASYEGNGIVTVTVENHSDKTLTFQPKLKLVEWITDEEITPLSGGVSFSGQTIAPHSVGTMVIDLSAAYDMAALEKSPAALWHCLVLTNQNFLFGQQWRCSVRFEARLLELPEEPGEWAYVEPAILERMEPELREYFLEEYVDIFAAYPGHYTYLQKVQEIMLRSGKRFVQPVNPWLSIAPIPDGVIMDESWDADRQYQLAGCSSSVKDAFGKLVSDAYNGYTRYLYVSLEHAKNRYCYSSWELPLLYFSTYHKTAIQSPEDCVVIHGQIWSLRELEPYKIYEDDRYVTYHVTSLYYTDLKAYVQNVLAREAAYGSEKNTITRQQYARIENIYNYYMENLEILSREEYLAGRTVYDVSDINFDRERGLWGSVTCSRDMQKLVLAVLDENDQVLRAFTVIPEDPRSFDFARLTEAEAFLEGLPAGTYSIQVEAWAQGGFHARQSIFGRVLEL